MNFTWLNKQGVRSDTGFEVQSVDRFTMEYREGRSIITVDVENVMISETPGVAITSNAFERWNPESGGERLTPEQQQTVLRNFTEALKFQGLCLSVDPVIPQINFTWLNTETLHGDAGFEVQNLDPSTMEYRAGGRAITIHVKPIRILESNGVSISSDAFAKWNSDSGGNELTPEQQQVALHNFKEALAFQGKCLSVRHDFAKRNPSK